MSLEVVDPLAHRALQALMRAVEPTAFVFCGGEATLEVLGRLVYTVRQVGSAAPVFEYREAMPVTGDHSIPSLGSTPTEAAENLKQYVDTGKIEHTKVVQEHLGHSSYAITADIDSHVGPAQQREAADRRDQALRW